jgi:thiosulfate dehydrogenase (quinone) large subunit
MGSLIILDLDGGDCPLKRNHRPGKGPDAEGRLLDSLRVVRSPRLAALVRILTGILFVAEGYGKVSGRFVRGGFAGSAAAMRAEAWPFWRSFLTSVVLPHAAAFSWVIALGELALGIALLLGLWTRIAASAGALLMLTILLGQSYVSGSAWAGWITAGLTTKFALLLLLLVASVGYGAWGLDGRRRAKVRPGFR